MKSKSPVYQEQKGVTCQHPYGTIQNKCSDCGLPLKPFEVQRRELQKDIIEIKKNNRDSVKQIRCELDEIKRNMQNFFVTTNRQLSDMGTKLEEHMETPGGH